MSICQEIEQLKQRVLKLETIKSKDFTTEESSIKNDKYIYGVVEITGTTTGNITKSDTSAMLENWTLNFGVPEYEWAIGMKLHCDLFLEIESYSVCKDIIPFMKVFEAKQGISVPCCITKLFRGKTYRVIKGKTVEVNSTNAIGYFGEIGYWGITFNDMDDMDRETDDILLYSYLKCTGKWMAIT